MEIEDLNKLLLN